MAAAPEPPITSLGAVFTASLVTRRRRAIHDEVCTVQAELEIVSAPLMERLPVLPSRPLCASPTPIVRDPLFGTASAPLQNRVRTSVRTDIRILTY